MVSPDLDLRARYCDLFVRDIPLDAAYWGSRLAQDGRRIPLERRAEKGGLEGVCFFLPNLLLPTHLGFRPQAVLLDLRFSRWTRRLDQLIPWAMETRAPIVALHTLGDFDAESTLMNHKFETFVLDHVSLAGFQPSASSDKAVWADWGLAASSQFLEREHRIVDVQGAESVEASLITCNELLEKANKADPIDLARARWVISTLAQLATPMAFYETAARSLGRSTVRRLISQIGYRSARTFEVGPVLQTIRMQLEAIYDTLQGEHPRAVQLKSAIVTAAGAVGGDRTCCLVRDRVHAKALRSWFELEAFPNGDDSLRVQINGVEEHHYRNREFKTFVINGAFPRRYRWVLGDALAPTVVFVAFQHEIAPIAAHLNQFYDPTLSTKRAEGRLRTLQRLGSGIIAAVVSDPLPAQLKLERPPLKKAKAKPASVASGKSFADLASLVKTVEQKSIATVISSATPRLPEPEEEPPDEEEERGDATDGVLCLRVEVRSHARGEGYFYFPCSTLVECVKPADPEKLVKVPPRALATGDVLPQIDERGKTSVFETIISLLDAQPTMRPVTAARRQWQIALVRLIDQRRLSRHLLDDFAPTLDYSKILLDLQKEGATVQTEQSVRGWINGQTIGPDSVGSIRAVGIVSGSEAVSNNAGDLDRAFRKIRALHQGVGRRLAGALRKSVKSFATTGMTSAPEDIDAHLRLPLAELIESIDFVEVLAVSADPILVSAGSSARFRVS